MQKVTHSLYTDQCVSDLQELKTSLTTATIARYEPLIASIETIHYFTVYINPESETRPEYLLRVKKAKIAFLDYKRGIAYLPLEKQRIFVYQLIEGKEN